MSQSRQAMKAQMMAKMEAAVDKVLAKTEQSLTITDIEELAMEVQKQVGKQLTSLLVAQGSEASVPGPRCEKCQQEMHYKGQKRRYVRTRSGDIEIERAYYYCAECQQGSFPPR